MEAFVLPQPAGFLRRLLLLLFVAGFPANLAAEVLAPEKTESWSSQVRTGVLPNGLSYFVERGGQAGDKVEFRLIVRVGDAQALPKDQQVAHVVEHIVAAKLRDIDSKGTIQERMARFGGKWGLDGNAQTGNDVTLYHLRLAAELPGALETGLEILQDWSSAEPFSDEEIVRERQAVIEEGRGTSPIFIDLRETQRRTWLGSNPIYDYKTEAAGTLGATPARIRALHGNFYVASNMAVVVVGAIDPYQVEQEIRSRFSDVGAAGRPPVPVNIDISSLAGGAYRVISPEGRAEGSVALTYKYREAKPGTRERTLDRAVTLLAEPLLRDAFSNLIRPTGSAVRGGGVSLDLQHPAQSAGLAISQVRAVLRPRRSVDGLTAALRLAASIRSAGFSEQDVERARGIALSTIRPGPLSAAQLASRWQDVFLFGFAEPSAGDIRAAVEAMAPAEFNRRLALRFEPTTRDIFVIAPQADSANLPASSQIRGIIEQAERAEALSLSLRPPKIPVLDIVGSAADGSPGLAAEGGYIRWTLKRSGAVLLFKRVPGPRVQLTMLRRGGEARFEPDDAATAKTAMEIVRRSGLGGIDGRELAEFVGSRGISFDTIVAPGREGLIAGGPLKEWPLLIKLVRTQLLKPQCSPAALEEYLADTEADAMGQDPSYAALAAFEAGIERALVGEKFSEPSRPALKLQKLCGQFHAMFGDTANMVIVVHGDLDPFDALSAVSSGLDIEPRQQASSRFQARPLANIKAGRETLRLGDGVSANVRLVIQQPLGGNPQAGQIAGEILSDRILHRLREVEQGTYSATAGVSVLDTPDRALLYISFDCDPLNVDRMITATRDELSKLANLGFKAEEFEAARDRVKGRPKSTKDIAETWLGRGTLTSSDDADSGDVRDWIGSNIDLRKLREFVRNPS